jgi:hypothetical protein
MTAVFNCLSHRATTRYVNGLQSSSGRRLPRALTFFQGIGGSVGARCRAEQADHAHASGPAGWRHGRPARG